VSGVSIDEELTNLIKFQQAYNAAARIITVMDEMIDVLVSKTGVVGR
jgi:flagellar hook-associated protein 1 FlgK